MGLPFQTTKDKHKWVSVPPWKTLCQNCISQLLFSTASPSHFKFPSLFTFSVSWKVENLSNVASWKVRTGSKQTNTCQGGRKSGTTCHISHPRKSTADFLHRQALLHCALSLTPPFCSPLIFCLLWSSTYRPRPYQKSQPDENFRGEGR